MNQDKIFLLKGKIQNYAWGGYDFIPRLLNVENPDHKPVAEYWMGAHPSASSKILVDGKEVSLNDEINKNPKVFIGEKVEQRFGELPYLFKILDVRELLSIQVHPSKTEAEKGFDAEEAAGILITDKARNYKDRNHKPEVMVALSEFWLLHGFLEKEKLSTVLKSVPEFETLVPVFEKESYKGLYKYVMELPQTQVDSILQPLVERELANNSSDKSQPGFWVRRVYEYAQTKELVNIDRGIFSIYFFNIVKALPGEAIFQGAGIPHAYMEGQNVELMANSDNVLRGGLTPKHIDVPELLKHTKFEGVIPNVMKGELLLNHEKNYPCPVPDFGISKIELSSSESIENTSFSAEIIIVTEGEISFQHEDKTLTLFHGEAAFILPETKYTIHSETEGTAFKAFVPKID
ncbi:mannose-6-phosphate isomerase, class I [Arachidicoccus ginsenosidimutans]|uniref:mannose-6-phosphate isomerase, class I n=1 Tax=Arachidicoccus sp. BS20 TaxID=1850526 RepID=UPI0007F08B2D|nr:mannose-6-phosphate isomerase, class I [Arachidicoccus sp. BS20]ANI89567.1 mannose-6-phosphate isomerase, class I [Arachidicoccus sp. BS20]